MSPSPASTTLAFETELFFSLRRQRSIAWGVAGVSLLTALGASLALAMALPLKEIRPYVVMVDRSTGESELVVSTRPGTLAERNAVREAELVRYVSSRETYDPADNAERIPMVAGLSEGQADVSLRALWTAAAENYPPNLYGAETRISVRVRAVSILSEDAAQVRFVRRLEKPGIQPVERDFVATIGFAFRPRVERTLEQVWANPLGFTVTRYRVDAETLRPREG